MKTNLSANLLVFAPSAVLAALLGTGCAGTALVAPSIAPQTNTMAFMRIEQPVPDARRTPTAERTAVVYRIDDRIRPAAIRVCERAFKKPEKCAERFAKRTLEVAESDTTINAFVGPSYNLTVLGGLVAIAGSDAEIAAVLAHEYSHALMRHPSKSMRNAALGALVGGLAGAAVGAAVDDPDWIDTGANVGYAAGSLIFSPKMELEADHLGQFILHEAGYDVKTATDFHVRMLNMSRTAVTKGQKGILGFLRTHPSPERRIENLIQTEALILGGARNPTWKKD